jgi:hypothetical protein
MRNDMSFPYLGKNNARQQLAPHLTSLAVVIGFSPVDRSPVGLQVSLSLQPLFQTCPVAHHQYRKAVTLRVGFVDDTIVDAVYGANGHP